MQLHRPEATDDRQCGNLEFLCKEKRTAHLRRTLLETQDLLHIPLSFWEEAGHQTDRGGWWVRALSEELTSKCGKCKRIWPALQLAKEGCTDCKVERLRRQTSPKKKKDTGPRDAVGPSRRNRKNMPTKSHLRLHSHIAPHSTLFGGHDSRHGYIGDRRPH